MFHLLWWSTLFLIQWQCRTYCEALAESVVPPNSPLKSLDLSNKNLDNENFFRKLQHQINMKDVEELILRNNKFNSFVDCATNVSNLRSLDLSYNRLTKFYFVCDNEYNLTTLNISHNQIEYINDQALSDKIFKLKTLDASYNDLFVVNQTMLQHMKNLEYLSLASNPIGDNIDESVFQNITNLKHLNFRNISSSFFSTSLFEPLVNLEYLDLSENPIEDVPPLPISIKVLYMSNTLISHVGTFIMPQLHVLNFDYSNNLTSILLNNFENLTQLEILSIRNSPKLTEIRMKHVNSPYPLLPKLKRLYLQNCGLKSLSLILKPIFQRTKVLDLHNNPWNCDCHLSWIMHMNLTTELINNFRCHEPVLYRNKLIVDIPRDELVCESPDSGRVFLMIFWICLIFILFGLFVTGIVYFARSCLSQWAMKIRHRGHDTVSYANVVNENDLVRILPENDMNDQIINHMEI